MHVGQTGGGPSPSLQNNPVPGIETVRSSDFFTASPPAAAPPRGNLRFPRAPLRRPAPPRSSGRGAWRAILGARGSPHLNLARVAGSHWALAPFRPAGEDISSSQSPKEEAASNALACRSASGGGFYQRLASAPPRLEGPHSSRALLVRDPRAPPTRAHGALRNQTKSVTSLTSLGSPKTPSLARATTRSRGLLGGLAPAFTAPRKGGSVCPLRRSTSRQGAPARGGRLPPPPPTGSTREAILASTAAR